MIRVRAAHRLIRAGRRWAGIPARCRGVILLYHRVACPDTDPWDLCVSPRNFAEQMKALRTLGRCVAVRDLMPAIGGKTGRRPVFSVTFDDGYADNATAAQPILAEQDVPATFFVVSDTVGSQQEFWWDALERVFLTPGDLPARLELPLGERVHAIELGPAATYSAEDARRDATWRADEPPPGRRQAAFLEVWRLLVGMPGPARDALVARILDWAGQDAAARQDYAIMSAGQLSALACADGTEVGGHTRTHPSLPDLPPEAQAEEICGGKAELERLLGRPVTSFSYPFGRFTEAAMDAVRRAGFSVACTTRGGGISRGVEHMSLPRVQVKDWDGPTFREIVMSYVRA